MARALQIAPQSATHKHGTFEWLVDWREVKPALLPILAISEGASWRCCELGCGSSSLASDVSEDAWCREVTSVDRSGAIIAMMKKRYAGRPELLWARADLGRTWDRSGGVGAAPRLAEAHYDLAIDKGTIDAILAEDGEVTTLACEVWRCLKAGGLYAIISYNAEALLRSILVPDAGSFFEHVASHQLPESPNIALLVLRKVELAPGAMLAAAPLGIDEDAVRVHQRAVINKWFTTRQAMLTPEMRSKIANAFSESLDVRLSLEDAHVALFDASERSVYIVTDFKADVARTPGLEGCTELGWATSLSFIECNQ